MPTTATDHLYATHITQALPRWSTQLSRIHASRLLQSLRKEYLDNEGRPHAWYATASAASQQQLGQAIRQRDRSREALAKALAPLQGINDFCTPLLEQALGIKASVLTAQYRFQPWREPVFVDPLGTEPPLGSVREQPAPGVEAVGDAQSRSLLAAALHNFEREDEAGPLSQLQQGPGDPSPLPGLTPGQFVRRCRALDLGQQYQAHLAQVFDAAGWQASMVQANRDELAVCALVAHLQGLLSAARYQALLQLCQPDTDAYYDQRPVACRQIMLLGTPIHEVLVIGPFDADRVNPCIVYIPGDPLHPVREYASLQAWGRAFESRLVSTTFRRLLIGYAPRRLQPALAGRLQHALFETVNEPAAGLAPRANAHLDVQERTLPARPWHHLARAHVTKLREDARAVAVPTADADAQARREQLEHWLELGLDVVNVAAMFIPLLNPLMLAIGAAQVMGDIFHGIQAWEDGDTAQALAHVESLLVNVIAVGALAGGAAAIKASGFVEQMRSVFVDDAERLWHPDLTPYRSSVTLAAESEPNPMGQYSSGGRSFIRLDGELFEHYQEADGQWRIRHPSDPIAYSPRLKHNGKGAWRLDVEQPLEWERLRLLRRIGPVTQGLDDHQLELALRACGTEEGVLQRMHLADEPPPALLEDALKRLKADQEVDDIIARTRYKLPLAAYKSFASSALVELPGWPADHLLQVFDGPEPWGSSVSYGRTREAGDTLVQVTRTELENGELASSVLDQLEEQAAVALVGEHVPAQGRAQALQDHLADHLEQKRQSLFSSLYQGHREPSGTAAATLGRQFPSLPPDALEEIVRHASSAERQRMSVQGRVPLRIAEEARHVQARVRLDRAILGLARPGLANEDSRRLLAGLQHQHPDISPTTLFDTAAADRAHSGQLIGQQPAAPGWRSPLRLADGRLGYPLSGRSAGPVDRRLRALFPELDSTQIRQLRDGLGSNPATALRKLEQEYHTLDRGLAHWTHASADFLEHEHRAECSERLKNAWRKEGGVMREYLTLDNMQLSELPPLTARLEHIKALKLENLDLQRMSADFLDSFPNLEQLYISGNPAIDSESLFQGLKAARNVQELHLTGNQLSGITPSARDALSGMRRLRLLNLRRNLLVLNESDLEFIARLKQDALSLANNRITLDDAMARRFQDLVHTQILHLELNPLRVAPDLSFMARLDHLNLSHCELTAWPPGLGTLMRQPRYQLRHLDLSANRIAAVPALDAIVQTPFARDLAAGVRGRRWLFNYNELESSIRSRLRGIGVSVFEDQPDIADWQAFWTVDSTSAQAALWAALFDEGAHQGLLEVLERLAGSAEAQRQPVALRTRVWALLSKAGEDTALRERLDTLAQTFPATCGDAGTDAFSALEIEVLSYEAGQGAQVGPAQLQLYRKLYRRAQVNQLAERIAYKRGLRKAALTDYLDDLPALDDLDVPEDLPDIDLRQTLVDDIEIRLALRQGLARTLDYPEPSHGMLYRETAQVSARVQHNVAEAVRLLDTDVNARLEWIADQPAWQDALKRRYAVQFEVLTDYWRAGLDYLDYCLDPGGMAITRLAPSVSTTLAEALGLPLLDSQGNLQRVEVNSEQYNLAINALLSEQKTVEDGLLLSLTRGLETGPD